MALAARAGKFRFNNRARVNDRMQRAAMGILVAAIFAASTNVSHTKPSLRGNPRQRSWSYCSAPFALNHGSIIQVRNCD